MHTFDPASDVDEKDDLNYGEEGQLFLNEITNLDCAFFDQSHGILGQSWHVDVLLKGQLNENGFVYDFSQLKNLVRQTLKSSIDHALVIPVGSETVHYSETNGGEHWLLAAKSKASSINFSWEYTCPKGAVYPIRCVALTPALLEQELARLLKHRLPPSVYDITVKLRSESVSPTEAVFRYTHGIAGHEGLCQRLFHGHKSRLEVYVAGERRADLEHFVCRDLLGTNVHIATPAQLVDPNHWEIGSRGPAGKSVKLNFKGSLGTYGATLPAENVFLVERETSIECLSKALAKALTKKFAFKDPIKVVSYEGIGKGGIALI